MYCGSEIGVNDDRKVVYGYLLGQTVEEHIPFASGTPDNPLTDEKLTEKYHSMAESVLGSMGAQELAEKTWTIDEVDDFQHIIRLTLSSQ